MYSTSEIKAAPVRQQKRIITLDVVRGVALLGILLMNIAGVGLVYAYGDPSVSGGDQGLNLLVYNISDLLFEGTMRGLFTMLFGTGFILLVSRIEAKGLGVVSADIYYRRVIWLFLFGLFHAWVILWSGDILYHYGLFGLFLFPLRNTKPLYLFAGGLFLLFVGVFNDISHYRDAVDLQKEISEIQQVKAAGTTSLNYQQETSVAKWEALNRKPTEQEINSALENLRGDYFSARKQTAKLTTKLESTFTYNFFVWDVMSFLLIGMAFFKWGIIQGRKKHRFYLIMMLAGYLIGLSLNYYELQVKTDNNFDSLAMLEANRTYQIGRFFVTMGHIGLIILVIKSGFLGWIQRSLAAVGRMALTNYLMQSILCTFFFYGYGLGMVGRLERYELYYVVFAVWILQMIYSPVWLKYFRYGPAEWLWRSLTYKEKQPFRKAA
ncbi:DUF418 domain-containing protein [Robertkochia aurantiaca]|uniref:DUF418 domain-containing protein n=1 Tax=Robertkochia aurantiaca TaxID=2873700 RepID=UPI001CCD6BFC|nr:DUF418 domain-containing protein [Robertkochia sp. 3YJGBD-33]